MKKNMGPEDSYIRCLLGVTFLVNIIILEPGIVGTILLALFGILFLVTAYIHFCPLYVPLKIDTIEGKKAVEEPKTESA